MEHANLTQVRLEDLGWGAFFENYLAAHPDRGVPMRVVVEHRNRFQLLGSGGEALLPVTGALRDEGPRPAVGDWVLVKDGYIQAVVPRRTKFARQAAGRKVKEQVIAANIDLVFIVSSFDELN